MIVSENLFLDIEQRKKKMDEQIGKASLMDWLLNFFKTSIDEEALLHSCRLEHNLNNSNDEFNHCYKNLENAWEWGLKNFQFNFDEDFIIGIGKRVAPEEAGGYRTLDINGVRPTGAAVTPPYPAKVPYEMEKLMKNIEYGRTAWKDGKTSVIELAVMTHYHLLRIHPFRDGNGRTARLIQNLIINQFGYPATIIHKGDKVEYINHLGEADQDFRFRDNNNDFLRDISKGERNVYDYLASRINTSIDFILDKAYKK